jgi:hypothetical protein
VLRPPDVHSAYRASSQRRLHVRGVPKKIGRGCPQPRRRPVPAPRPLAFFKWHATEDRDEQRPNPMACLKPTQDRREARPVFSDDELAALLRTCKGDGFQNRCDYPSSSRSRTLAPGCPSWPRSPNRTSRRASARRSSPARATSSGRSSSPTKRPARMTAANASRLGTRWHG